MFADAAQKALTLKNVDRRNFRGAALRAHAAARAVIRIDRWHKNGVLGDLTRMRPERLGLVAHGADAPADFTAKALPGQARDGINRGNAHWRFFDVLHPAVKSP